MENRTIAAIATPNAPGGIGIVRISGDNALEIASRIFRPVSGKALTESKGYRAYFGDVYDNNEKIDEAVCLVFRAPSSYTGEDTEAGDMLPIFEKTKSALSDIIRRYDCGRAVTDGIDAVIVGKPNVGKSTLMNMLTGFERSIVTDIAGTTRDVVEEKIVLGEIIMRVADTAGIRETENIVENIGVNLAKRRLERAELVLAVFDSNVPLNSDDLDIIEQCRGKKAIALLNKSDLPMTADRKIIDDNFPYTVELSAATGEGRDALENAVRSIFRTNEFDPNSACLTSERQRLCCVNAINHIDEAIAALNMGVTLDAVNVCADCAIDALLELTGDRATSAVVDEVFSRFCVGK